jgi:hypothetical protein
MVPANIFKINSPTLTKFNCHYETAIFKTLECAIRME